MLNVCFDEGAFYTMRFGLAEKYTHSYFALSYGLIDPKSFDDTREKRINHIYSLCTLEERNEMIKEEKKLFNEIINTAKVEKELRIWYANNAADKCGLYHLACALQGINCKIFVVEMPTSIGSRKPEWEKSWGEADPNDFHACLHLEREVDLAEREAFAKRWESLVAENSVLRVIIDGEVASVPADYLDEQILDLVPIDSEFKAGYLEGMSLGFLSHYLSCGFIDWRIEELIKQGKLVVVHRDNDPERWNMMVLRRC